MPGYCRRASYRSSSCITQGLVADIGSSIATRDLGYFSADGPVLLEDALRSSGNRDSFSSSFACLETRPALGPSVGTSGHSPLCSCSLRHPNVLSTPLLIRPRKLVAVPEPRRIRI